MSENMDSPLRFPDPYDFLNEKEFNIEEFSDEYKSCLIELGLIIEKIYDPVLRKKLTSLMKDTEEWLE